MSRMQSIQVGISGSGTTTPLMTGATTRSKRSVFTKRFASSPTIATVQRTAAAHVVDEVTAERATVYASPWRSRPIHSSSLASWSSA